MYDRHFRILNNRESKRSPPGSYSYKFSQKSVSPISGNLWGRQIKAAETLTRWYLWTIPAQSFALRKESILRSHHPVMHECVSVSECECGNVWARVTPFHLLKQLTNLHETWDQYHVAGAPPTSCFLIRSESMTTNKMADARNCKERPTVMSLNLRSKNI